MDTRSCVHQASGHEAPTALSITTRDTNGDMYGVSSICSSGVWVHMGGKQLGLRTI